MGELTMDIHKFKKLFGERIKTLRQRANLSQDQLADKIQRAINTVSNIERGTVSPKIETISLIASALNVELSELFEISDTPSSDKVKRKEVEKIVSLLKDQDIETIRSARQQIKILLGVKN